MLKKPHVSGCCYRKNGDFNPSYHDCLDAHKTEGEREIERDLERERERERSERERERERGDVHNKSK